MVRPGGVEVDRSGCQLDPLQRGLAYEAGDQPVKTVWSIAAGVDGLYAGVEPAGLFRSEDGGQSWRHVEGLRRHPTQPHWSPGGAGLILHSLVPHPTDARKIWVGISAAGVFHTADGGETWEPRNQGTRADFLPEGQNYPEFGQCVHCLVRAPGEADRLYQQNHCGMYRSEDGGRRWDSIEAGLPSSFGFPAAAHPRDADDALPRPAQRRFGRPLRAGGQGRRLSDARWRCELGGDAPGPAAAERVFRRAPPGDGDRRLEPAGVYFGTNTGALYASADEGESWSCIAQHLPVVSSVETLVVDAIRPAHGGCRGGGCCRTRCSTSFRARRSASRSRPRTVGEMIDALDARWPGMRDRLCDSTPRLRRHINVFIDGERAGLETPLAAGARVYVIPAITGG